ncbi:MAG: 50S ribosomal protein L9 [Deltaproteobacteria bacterium]|nr:50S ribosomal protein L9 [Deltaproteobacteria bacterium]
MEVILVEDIQSLGNAGEIVKVKGGFARNYLLPQKKAFIANSKNKQLIEAQKRMIAANKAKQVSAAQALANQLNALELKIAVEVGDNEKLYGSVTRMDIARAISEAGIEIDRHIIDLENPIKELGEKEVSIKLHSDVKANVKVTIEAKS